MVTAVKLDDQVAFRHTSRKTDRAHHSLRAGIYCPNLLHPRYERTQTLCEENLVLRHDAEGGSLCRLSCNRRRYLIVRMTKNHRAPAAAVVRKLPAIGRIDLRPLTAAHHKRYASDSIERTNR